ncbi:MAG: glycosyltransferase family 4 protein [Phycisphaerales bacterium]
MRVLWPHNFDPSRLNCGCFMYTAARGLMDLGVDVRLEYLGNLRNPIAIAAARRRVERIAADFDVVHAQYGSACSLATSACGQPAVVSIRGNDWNVYSASAHPLWLHTRVARCMTMSALRGYRAVVCVSHRIAQELSRHCRADTEVLVLPSAIDLSLWPETLSVQQERRQMHRVLFTSNTKCDPIKRAWLLKRAVAIASARVGRIEVVLATGIPHEEMPALVASCDAVACTSETEGWPNSVKEALACGIPFVSTDVSDLWAIANSEPSCRIVEPNPESFAQGLCEVLAAGRDPNLRRHVLHMGLEPASRSLLALYERLAAR